MAYLIGEPKHGVWRIQDNGHVREWRRRGHVGLDRNVDPNSGRRLLLGARLGPLVPKVVGSHSCAEVDRLINGNQHSDRGSVKLTYLINIIDKGLFKKKCIMN